MLADPYFPKFGLMDKTMQEIERHYYDFLVRYEEVLALDTLDAPDRAEALTIDGIETHKTRAKDQVAVDLLNSRYRADGEVGPDDWPEFQLDGAGTWLWSPAEFVRYTRVVPLPAEGSRR